MKTTRIDVLREVSPPRGIGPDSVVISFAELCRELRSLRGWKHVFAYTSANLHTANVGELRRPFLTAILMRILSRGCCAIVDATGARHDVSLAHLGRLFGQLVKDFWQSGRVLTNIEDTVGQLAHTAGVLRSFASLDRSAPPIYLRTEQIFGTIAGGSVGHTAGVLNNLGHVFGKPCFFSSTPIGTVAADIPTYIIPPQPGFRDFPYLNDYRYNEHFTNQVRAHLGDRRPAFVYQRYCLNNYSGVELARGYGVPLVLEFNGSEVWVNRNWGKRPAARYERLSEQIERVNLTAADLIVVVSQPIKDDLVAAGIPADRILVNPNGVDCERYSPNVAAGPVRGRHGLEGRTVIGFIGTFGPWHGAEVLVDAVGGLLREHPTYRDRIRLLLIGDGATMPEVCKRLGAWGLTDVCVRTGLVPQQEGPGYLAACDLLVAPHVPNSDGTPFFGSPTKLYEYMAMGKGIVASALGQIAEVLEHDRTAWLVTPGRSQSLAAGLKTLIDDPVRCARLGAAARDTAVSRHSWHRHTTRIIEVLLERCKSSEMASVSEQGRGIVAAA